MVEEVLVMIKHEAIEQRQVGTVLTYFESSGFTLKTIYNMNMQISDIIDLYNMSGSFPEDTDIDSMADKRNIAAFLTNEKAHSFMNENRPDRFLPIVYLKVNKDD